VHPNGLRKALITDQETAQFQTEEDSRPGDKLDLIWRRMNPLQSSASVRCCAMALAIFIAECLVSATTWAGLVQFTSANGYVPGTLNGQPGGTPEWVVLNSATAYTVPSGAGKVVLGTSQTASQYAVWQIAADPSQSPTFSYSVDFNFTQSAGTGSGNALGLPIFTNGNSGNSNVRAYFGRTSGTDAYRIGFFQNSGTVGTSVTQNVTGVNLGLNSLGGDNVSDNIRLIYTLSKGATSWIATVNLLNITTGAFIGHLVSPAFNPSTSFNSDASLYCAFSTETLQTAAISSFNLLACDLPQPSSPSAGLTLTFNDDFTNGLDRTKWNPHYTKSTGGSLEAYVPDAFSIAPGGGSLRITATDEPYAGRNYTSGAMTTYGSFAQTYGYFEMRAKVPKGYGFWPAFWLLPVNQSWPPEIDAMEILGKDTTTVHQTLHWPGPQNQDLADGSAFVGPDLSLAYHTYGVSWKPGIIIFYVDGIERYRVTSTNVPSLPMYLVANMAIGPSTGGWAQPPNASTVFPNYYDIDYIRAYQYSDVPVVPPEAISLGITSASSETVAPGGTITFSSSVKAGNTGFTTNPIHLYIQDFWGNPLSPVIDLVVPAKVVPAGGATPFSFTYTVPATLAPGMYSVKIYAAISGTNTYTAIGCATRFTVSNP
jgi:beta-glucanase (GH16 family)